MKSKSLSAFIWGFGLTLFLVSCSSKELTDQDAKSTAMQFISKSSNAVTLLEWKGLIKSSKVQMKGKAELHSLRSGGDMNVDFIFDKDANNNWVLDKMDGDATYQVDADWINQSVYEKISNLK